MSPHPSMAWLRGLSLALVLTFCGPTIGLGQDDRPLTPEERKSLLEQAEKRNQAAIAAFQKGDAASALRLLQESLAAYEKVYQDQDHSNLATSLNNMGFVLESLGQADRALPFYEQSLKMRERLHKDQDHPDLATSLNNMGFVLKSLGEAVKALPFYEQSLKMRERLYKNQDHPDLASSLNNMGFVLESLGHADRALPFFEQSLKMRERLYKNQDHPDLAGSLNNMGGVLQSLGQADRALPFFEQSLKMVERLHKDQDHSNLASSLNNMGAVLQSLGQAEKALPFYERSLKMRERLHKDQDHSELAWCLDNMGAVLQTLAHYDRALSFFERLSRVNAAILKREVTFAPEAEALDRLRTLPNPRAAYLRLARIQATEPARVATYLWLGQSAVTRIVERRHLASQETDASRAKRAELAGLRAQLTGALLRPGSDPNRSTLLRELTDAKEKAERELLQLLPPRLRPGKDITPDDLANALPADAVYVDLLRYDDQDENKKPQAHYVAFVHGPKAKPIRIDLGPAREIDTAANAWWQAVLAYPQAPASGRIELHREADRHAASLKARVWDRLAAALPKETATVYLTVEGDLGRFPFAALPGEQADSVLLQRYAFVHVPHGPALVERLRGKPGVEDGTGTLLAVGGVDYGPSPEGQGWQPLAGTARERAQLERLAGGRTKPSLGGPDATTGRVAAELPKATYAHLATHGRFDAETFLADRKRAAEFQTKLQSFEIGRGVPQRLGLGSRSPLAYVGLVLAGANTPEKAGSDGGILSGETIAGLQLEGLRLVVLSACETGLGANTDTEGVRGLQRAFHVAGCPNVVASLWEVDDEATAALMNAFWEKVLTQKMPPAQALREAQLLIATRLDLVPLLASRGGGFGKVVRVNPTKEAAPKGTKRAHPYLWAAFFFSASGR